jgi:hypothetical protein
MEGSLQRLTLGIPDPLEQLMKVKWSNTYASSTPDEVLELHIELYREAAAKIKLICALGTVSLGHRYPKVSQKNQCIDMKHFIIKHTCFLHTALLCGTCVAFPCGLGGH